MSIRQDKVRPPAFFVGTRSVSAIYLGRDLVWRAVDPLNHGVYAVAGAELSWFVSRVRLDSGSFALAGEDISAVPTYALDSGSYAVTGAELGWTQIFVLDAGAFVLQGAELAWFPERIELDSGAFALVGEELDWTQAVLLDHGSFALQGVELGLIREFGLGVGSFVLQGEQLTVDDPGAGVYELESGQFTLTGNVLNWEEVVPEPVFEIDLSNYGVGIVAKIEANVSRQMNYTGAAVTRMQSSAQRIYNFTAAVIVKES